MIELTVYGKAEPAGSKTKTRFGVRDDNPKTKPWQAEIKKAAGETMNGRTALEGPLAAHVVFYLKRPKGHYLPNGEFNAAGRRNRYPTTKPDATKLMRAVEDALTGIVYRDDNQIVWQQVSKCYADDGPVRVQIQINPV